MKLLILSPLYKYRRKHPKRGKIVDLTELSRYSEQRYFLIHVCNLEIIPDMFGGHMYVPRQVEIDGKKVWVEWYL